MMFRQIEGVIFAELGFKVNIPSQDSTGVIIGEVIYTHRLEGDSPKYISLDLSDSTVSLGGNNVFRNCDNLVSITLPSTSISLSIGNNAFENCTSLASITIPSRFTSIGNSAFSGCTSLESVTFERNNTTTIDNTNAFPGNLVAVTGGTGAQNRYGTYITNTPGNNPAWLDASSDPNTIDPNNITNAGDFALYLATATGGDTADNPISVKVNVSALGGPFDSGGSIGNTIYSYRLNGDNPKYISIDLSGSTFTSIDNSAFRNCDNLVSITIPDGVTSIGTYAFSGCSNLTTITIPDSVQSIGNYAFSGCTSLTSINIPDGVTSIGGSAFRDCTSLTNITIPNGVASIGTYAFSGCTSLTSINIPDGVTSIEGSAFRNCTSLTNITIPDGVTSIGSYTFNGCSSLQTVTLLRWVSPDTITTLANTNAFGITTALTAIYVPQGSLDVYKAATNWSSITNNIVNLLQEMP